MAAAWNVKGENKISRFCEFWVQLHDIPSDMLKEDVIVCIARDLGSIVPQFSRRDVEKWTRFARVKINIDIF